MISAIILVDVVRGSAQKVGQNISYLSGVKAVYSVAGRFDLVVIGQSDDMDGLSTLVNHDLDKIEDIRCVETLVSMQVFSERDLESMFDVGF